MPAVSTQRAGRDRRDPIEISRKLPKDFDADLYKERHKVERFFGRLKASFRRIATRVRAAGAV